MKSKRSKYLISKFAAVLIILLSEGMFANALAQDDVSSVRDDLWSGIITVIRREPSSEAQRNILLGFPAKHWKPANEEGLAFLIDALTRKNPTSRLSAVKALGQVADTSIELVVPALAKALADESSDVRQASAAVLEKLDETGRQQSLPVLKELFSNPDEGLRRGALAALLSISKAEILKDEISTLTEMLSSDEWGVRRDVVKALGQVADASIELVVPALAKALADESSDVRQAAAAALEKLDETGRQQSLPVLKELFSNPDERLRRGALAALLSISKAEILKDEISVLTEMLSSDEWEVRRDVVKALGQVADASIELVVPALAKALADESSDVRQAAAVAFDNLDETDRRLFTPILKELFSNVNKEHRRRVLAALLLLGEAEVFDDEISTLTEMLSSDDWEVRRDVVKALGQVADASIELVVPALAKILADEDDDDVRQAAAAVLEKLDETGRQQFLPVLKELFSSPDERLRPRVFAALLSIGDAEILKDEISVLTKMLSSDDWGVRLQVVMALGQVADTSIELVVPALAKALADEDDDVRQAAAAVLEKLDETGRQQFLPVLKELFSSPDERLRLRVFAAFLSIGDAEILKDEISVLTEMLSSDEWEVRLQGVKALGQVADTSIELVVPALARALADEDVDVRQAAAAVLEKLDETGRQQSLPVLKELFSNPDERLRRGALAALLSIGDAEILKDEISVLTKMLSSDDWEVRWDVVKALGQVADASIELVVPALAKALADESSDVRQASAAVLEKLDETGKQQSLPVLKELFSNPDERLHRGALAALMSIGDAEILKDEISTLTEMLSSDDWEVRRDVVKALGQVADASIELVVPALARALADEDVDVRQAAAAALEKLDETGRQQSLPVLKELFSNPDEGLRRGALAALLSISKAEILKDEISVLTKMLSSDDWEVRRDVVKALGQVADTSIELVVPALAKALADESSDVRQASAAVLEKLDETGRQQSFPVLKELFSNPDERLRLRVFAALLSIGDAEILKDEISTLTEMLSSDDWGVRLQVVKALGQVADTSIELVAPALAKALVDEHSSVQQMATEVQEKLDITKKNKVINSLIGMISEFDVSKIKKTLSLIEKYTPISSKKYPKNSINLLNSTHHWRTKTSSLRIFARIYARGNEEIQILADWTGRPTTNLLDELKIDPERAKRILQAFVVVWPDTVNSEDLRFELARSMVNVLRSVSSNLIQNDLSLLKDLRSQLVSAGNRKFEAQSIYVDGLIEGLEPNRIAQTTLLVWAGHALTWFLLVFAYPYSRPVQTIFFWNKWVRWFAGFGYVAILLAWVPFLRRRLFSPFRTSLLADAHVDEFKEFNYFADSEVRFEKSGEQESLTNAIPEINGQIVLQGESGLGKTMFVRWLAKNSRRIVVYLPAAKCVDGVMTAIQSKVEGPARDPSFLRSLVFAGGLDVIIDGLNEVSATTHARIVEFADSHFAGNILLSTQPMEWTPPANAKVCELQPLSREQMETFLHTRSIALPNEAVITGPHYEEACSDFIARAFGQGKSELRSAMIRALSNPMDLTVIADMIALDEQPNLLNLREQQYTVMAEDYRHRHNGRSFPLVEFAERAFDLRLSDCDHFEDGEFSEELARMEAHRMIVWRPSYDEEHNEIVAGFFRHEKVLDFFLYQAFTGDNKDRQHEYFSDARFRGVYLLLAILLPYEHAMQLRERLVDLAAETKDHSLSDQFVLLLQQRRSQ